MGAHPAARPEPLGSLVLCFSHLRWDFVFQRPQHLMTRAARTSSVLYWEEPVLADCEAPRLERRADPSGVTIAMPVLPQEGDESDRPRAIRALLDGWLAERARGEVIAWYYTPMALAFSDHLKPDLCVYDCMDELSAFQDPPPGLVEREDALFARADLVFTGGRSLYEAKRSRHPRVFTFPSSVDVAHFAKARRAEAPADAPPAAVPASSVEPADQAAIPRPRIGFFGVIDERMDLGLVAQAAAALPECQFVMLGPVVKIDPASLPRAPNLHWLGGKRYEELPAYLGGWAAGWMPFALNDATRFISPTKTPEFLAAGLPVASTAIADVVAEYGEGGLVSILDAATLRERLEALLSPPSPEWRERVDRHLARGSWDRTWARMRERIDHLRAPRARRTKKTGALA